MRKCLHFVIEKSALERLCGGIKAGTKASKKAFNGVLKTAPTTQNDLKLHTKKHYNPAAFGDFCHS